MAEYDEDGEKITGVQPSGNNDGYTYFGCLPPL